MKFAIVLALIGLLATAHAGDSSNNPCKAKGMFRANTGDVTNFVRAAGLAPYVELGVCAYIYLVGPTNLDTKSINKITSMVDSLSTNAITPSASDVTTLATTIFDNCVVRDIELNYMCVGTPSGVYVDPRRRRSRALLGDDHFHSSELFPFFTRFAFSVSIKAKILDNYTWTTVKFPIELCVDINRAGTFGLPGDGDIAALCGELSFSNPPPPPP